MAKKAYRVRNWKKYNKALVQRGSLTFWFSEDIIKSWEKESFSEAHGNQRYSDMMIVSALTFRQLFRLPLRTTEGFLRSLVHLLKLEIPVPDYTTLCRRSKGLQVKLGVRATQQPRHVLVDSTGVKIIGEGEWKRLKHGECRHQMWRKLHLAIDAQTHDILSAEVTESVRLDGNYFPGLIVEIVDPIADITGDGAYDKKACYRKAYERGARPVFPPQHNAIVQRNKRRKDPALLARDKAILFIEKDESRRKLWKEEMGYHRRSLAETMMSRMKSLFGDQIRAKTLENQRTDLLIRCYAMNRMTALGMPISEAI